MNKTISILVAAVVVLTACKKEQVETFHAPQNIYFNLGYIGMKDSVLYTFAYHPERLKDTVWVPVVVSGDRMDMDRTYSVKVLDSGTTAQVNKHYEPLKASYTFKAGYGIQDLPVILYNTDTTLVKQARSITIQLVSTSDFNTDFSTLITTRVVFSNKLEKPNWWDMWLGGYYSQTKHQLFRLSATTDDLSTNGIDAPKNLYYVEKLKALLASPQTWISLNPDKGYKLDLRADGNYDFYYSGTPEKKTLYAKDASTGTFYFIDENGKQVI